MESQKYMNLVSRLHKEKAYRPVGVAVLYKLENNKIKYLVVQSSINLKSWLFPQGGIREKESIKQNLSRELKEELGIVFNRDVKDPIVYHFLYEKLDAEPTREDKRGFTKGKAYIFTLGQYVGNNEFKLQKKEIKTALWLTYEQALEHFNKGRPEKANLSKEGLDKTIDILKKKLSLEEFF